MQPHVLEEPRWASLQEVLRMAAPIALGSFSVVMMMMTDTYFVSKLGEAPLAAVSASGVWSYTVMSFFIGVVSCVATFVSQSLGRQQFFDCARYTWQGIYIAVASVAVAALLWPVSPYLFGAMGHTPEVTAQEDLYFRIRLFGFVPFVWLVAVSCFFQAVNRPNIPTYVSLAAVLLNGVLDYGLVLGNLGMPALGIGGAAWATVFSLTFQVVVLMAIFLGREFDSDYKTRSAFRIDASKMRELLRIGTHAGVMSVLDVTVWAVFIGVVVGSFGATAMAANSVALNIMHVSLLPALALNMAIAAIVGQWIGKGEPDKAAARTYTAIKLAACYMTVSGVFFAVFARQVIWVFSQDEAVLALGQRLLIIAAVFQAFDAINIVLLGALRGAGDTRWTAWMISGWAYGVFLPCALFMAFVLDLGAMGAWLGATVYIITLSGFMLSRFRGGRWKAIDIFAGRKPGEAPAAEPAPVTVQGQ